MNDSVSAPVGRLDRFLNAVERAGNKLPHITMLFIYALVLIWVLSFLLSFISLVQCTTSFVLLPQLLIANCQLLKIHCFVPGLLQQVAQGILRQPQL